MLTRNDAIHFRFRCSSSVPPLGNFANNSRQTLAVVGGLKLFWNRILNLRLKEKIVFV